MSTVKLKRLKINQYRNVRPGTELHFDDGVNLVLGQNGSGKTTLLGLLSMVCGWYFEELEDEEFASSTSSLLAIFDRCQVSHRRATIPRPWIPHLRLSTVADDYRNPHHGTASRLTTSSRSAQTVSSPFRAPLVMDWSFIAATQSDRGGPPPRCVS
jgi:energy-coupling factor transporter ATP-binding protein EcfA2